MLAVPVGKSDPTGSNRIRVRDKGKPLAGKSTLNRLELTPAGANKNSRYKKITVDRHAVDEFFAEVFLNSYSQAPSEIILDLDATDDPLHGHQSGRFFHGYYNNYCEYLAKGENPRFVVTSLSANEVDSRTLYEQRYCGRGDMENRIKEQQLWLFADRTSCATMRANQPRLWFSSVAYTLIQALRRLGLKGTKLARAQCGTIRLKLLKIAAQVRMTVRKVWVSFSESYPYQQLFWRVYRNLIGMCPIPLRC